MNHCSDEPQYTEDVYDGIYDADYGVWNEGDPPAEDTVNVGVVRVPPSLLRSLASLLQYETLPRAWMHAVAEKFPNTPLGELGARYPSLLPPWLLQGFAMYQGALLLRREGIFACRGSCNYWCFEDTCKAVSILTATSKCRFQEGFASEGMLCNDPPIPLRVLDFLEHAEDLLNLALVCKATHQAGHVLLQREFHGGMRPGLMTQYDIAWAVDRRKRSMLASALRHPISSTASGSTMTAATEAEGCAAQHAGGDDHVHEDILITVRKDGRHTNELDWCMLTMLWANALAATGRSSVRRRPRPFRECLLYESDVALEWRSSVNHGLAGGIVLGTEAVGMAVAHWAELQIKEPDQSSVRAATDAEHVMRVLRAAERHGQGVIVHPNCSCNPGQQGYALWL